MPRSNRTRGFTPVILVWLALSWVATAHAHVGSPDVYAEGDAGPYKLFVTIRPPAVIPGVAGIEVRTSPSKIDEIQIAPMPLTGEASRHPPVADVMKRSSEDRDFFTGNLWIMATGSWQIRFVVKGPPGEGQFAVPVAAAPTATLKMKPALGAALGLLGLLLVLGLVGIVGAAVSDAQLAPGAPVPAIERKRARLAMAAALLILLLAAWLGGEWWKADAARYANNIYRPLEMRAALNAGNVLDLSLANPASAPTGWMHSRKVDDFILDHDHLMHLYLIREPAMDILFHLHPELASAGHFRLELPSMPPGKYRLYADVVHSDGFPETLVSTALLPAITGRPLSGDDAEGISPPLSEVSGDAANASRNLFRLPDGYAMVWARPAVLKARQPQIFEFYLLDPKGRPPSDMALYMGMLGHAAFVRSDGAVFAHIHPSGTPAMAAMILAGQGSGAPGAAPMTMQMPMSSAPGQVTGALPNNVGFPYGFPSAGRYRIFVQMKHGNTIETGSFDAAVSP